MTWKQIRRRYYGKDRIRAGRLTLYNPATMRILRYRHRGRFIPNPWIEDPAAPQDWRHRHESRGDPVFLGWLAEALA